MLAKSSERLQHEARGESHTRAIVLVKAKSQAKGKARAKAGVKARDLPNRACMFPGLVVGQGSKNMASPASDSFLKSVLIIVRG